MYLWNTFSEEANHLRVFHSAECFWSQYRIIEYFRSNHPILIQCIVGEDSIFFIAFLQIPLPTTHLVICGVYVFFNFDQFPINGDELLFIICHFADLLIWNLIVNQTSEGGARMLYANAVKYLYKTEIFLVFSGLFRFRKEIWKNHRHLTSGFAKIWWRSLSKDVEKIGAQSEVHPAAPN